MQKFNSIYRERSKILAINSKYKDYKQLKDAIMSEAVYIDDFKVYKSHHNKNVLLVGAGLSAEREVSIMSSTGIANSLLDLGYKVTFIDMGRDIARVIEALQPDVVFNALHGTYGEDGCLPGLLNIMRVPYTGPGVLASALALNKNKSRDIFLSNNIKVADSVYIKKSDNIKKDPMSRPYVIKPLSQGSSVGIELIFENDDFNFAEYDFPYGDILVEKYIKGREMQVAVLNGKAIGVLEIQLLKNKRFYDYETKYTEGFSKHLCPAPIPEDIYQKALSISENACKAFDCEVGIIRVEFIYSEEEKDLYMLELNTHPGMTPLSICPEIVNVVNGISYTDLVKEILESAKFES